MPCRKVQAREAVSRGDGPAAVLPRYDLISRGAIFVGGARRGQISEDEYLKIYADILTRDEWIIDGYGSAASAWGTICAAAPGTLVYIDLPLLTHYGVTSRLVKGLFRNPPGWPENSPVWASTWDSYRMVWLCHHRLTPSYRKLVADASSSSGFTI